MNTITKKLPVALVLLAVSAMLLSYARHANADAWWGSGYRDPQWILERGGTIIYYEIKNKKNSGSYKLRLYLGDKLIETERNGSGIFDDAINNTYKIIVFKGTKKKSEAVFFAHPGETIRLKFDLKKDKVEKISEFIPKSKIRLTSDSSKYINASDIKSPSPAAKSLQQNEEEILKAKQEEERRRKMEIEKAAEAVRKKAEIIENKINQKSALINEALEDIDRENRFPYIFFSHAEQEISWAEENLLLIKEQVEQMEALLKDAPTDETKKEVEKKVHYLELSANAAEKAINERRDNLLFWNNLRELPDPGNEAELACN